MNQVEKKISSSKSISNLQLGLAIWMFISTVYEYENSRDSTYIVILLLGIWALYSSVKRKKLVKIAVKYVPILSKSGNYDILNLSSTIGKSENQTKEDIQKLINKGYIPNGYIDSTNNALILPEQFYSKWKNNQSVSNSLELTILCKSCGGENHVEKGKMSECQYCGSKIKG